MRSVLQTAGVKVGFFFRFSKKKEDILRDERPRYCATVIKNASTALSLAVQAHEELSCDSERSENIC